MPFNATQPPSRWPTSRPDVGPSPHSSATHRQQKRTTQRGCVTGVEGSTTCVTSSLLSSSAGDVPTLGLPNPIGHPQQSPSAAPRGTKRELEEPPSPRPAKVPRTGIFATLRYSRSRSPKRPRAAALLTDEDLGRVKRRRSKHKHLRRARVPKHKHHPKSSRRHRNRESPPSSGSSEVTSSKNTSVLLEQPSQASTSTLELGRGAASAEAPQQHV